MTTAYVVHAQTRTQLASTRRHAPRNVCPSDGARRLCGQIEMQVPRSSPRAAHPLPSSFFLRGALFFLARRVDERGATRARLVPRQRAWRQPASLGLPWSVNSGAAGMENMMQTLDPWSPRHQGGAGQESRGWASARGLRVPAQVGQGQDCDRAPELFMKILAEVL